MGMIKGTVKNVNRAKYLFSVTVLGNYVGITYYPFMRRKIDLYFNNAKDMLEFYDERIKKLSIIGEATVECL